MPSGVCGSLEPEYPSNVLSGEHQIGPIPAADGHRHRIAERFPLKLQACPHETSEFATPAARWEAGVGESGTRIYGRGGARHRAHSSVQARVTPEAPFVPGGVVPGAATQQRDTSSTAEDIPHGWVYCSPHRWIRGGVREVWLARTSRNSSERGGGVLPRSSCSSHRRC